MFNIAQYRKDADRLTDLLPWAALVAPGIVLNKDASLQQTLHFRGPDLASASDSQMVAAVARLNNVLKRFGSGWVLYVEAQREPLTSYPEENCFTDPVSALVDLQRRNAFMHEANNFETNYYLTLQYLPPAEQQKKVQAWFVKKDESDLKSDYHNAVQIFEQKIMRIKDILADFMYEVHLLDDVQTLTYLHSTVSTKNHIVSVPETPMYLDSLLADMPLVAGFSPKLGEKHLAVLSISGFPGSTTPALLDQLNQLPVEYRWSTRFIALDKPEAEKELKQYKRRWFSKRKGMLHFIQEIFTKSESQMQDTAAVEKARDADSAVKSLSEDHVAFGYYTSTVTVFADTAEAAQQKLREVERVINGLGFTTVSEDMHAVEAWLSSLPGHAYANVRKPLIHTLNLSHLLPLSATWAGQRRDEHLQAPVLMHVHTAGRTPFRIANHIGDVGHQMIVGPTGAGKSVLLNFMAMQFCRYKDAQVFIFDKGESFLSSTLSVGGDFYHLATDGTFSLQPLAAVDDKAERSWAREWLLGLLQNEGVEITPEVKSRLWEALHSMAMLPVEQRTMTGLQALLQDVPLRQALETYTVAGPYGHLLDADHEVASDVNWQCFEMESLMQQPSIVAPVLHYLFHRLARRFDGRPTLLILDEAWLFLDHPLFSDKMREWLKTLRKVNVSVVFATQSISDVLDSDIATAVIESCPSRIFLPNDRAHEPAIEPWYSKLGLNDKQINLIAHAYPKRQYYYQSSLGNSLFDLELDSLALACCAVQQPDKAWLREAVTKSYGERLPDFLRQKELSEYWNIIKESQVSLIDNKGAPKS